MGILESIFLSVVTGLQFYLLKKIDALDERLDNMKSEVIAFGWKLEGVNRRHSNDDRRE